jgi:hypothetical protein
MFIAKMVSIRLFDEMLVRRWVEQSPVVARSSEAIVLERNPIILFRMGDETSVIGGDPFSTEENLARDL